MAAAAPAANARTATVSRRRETTDATGSEQGIGRSKGGTRRDRIRISIRLPTAVRTIPPEAAATSLGEAAAAVTTATSNTEAAAAGGPTTGAGRLVASATTEQTDPPDPPDPIFGSKCSYSFT